MVANEQTVIRKEGFSMRVEDIVNKVFARSFMGYDIEQVDFFLDEVIERFEQYESEKKEMLLAMEYLLNKLEQGQKLPITEMRKAIDTGKTQKKSPAQNSREPAPEPALSRPKKSGTDREEAKPARSIARGAQPPKPIRAPKVSRVRSEQDPPTQETIERVVASAKAETPELQIQADAGAASPGNGAPAAENWLDELLINLIEREKVGYGEPLKSAETTPCNNGDIDLLQTAQDDAEPDEARAHEPEHESPAVEEEPR